MKRVIILLLCTFFAVLSFGCQRKDRVEIPDVEKGIYGVFYMDTTGTKLISKNYEVQETDRSERVIELLEQMKEIPEGSDVQPVIPESVRIPGVRLDGNFLTLNFEGGYSAMEPVDEILCRAGIVKTLTQIDGVEQIRFNAGDQPIVDAKGNHVDFMTAADFAEYSGSMVNDVQKTTLTLYFANETGDKLVETDISVVHQSNSPRELLIMEQLIKGPDDIVGAFPSIPSGTKVLDISVVDNICYLNLSSGFLEKKDMTVEAQIPVYSIVNSLSEMASVNKVQISVEGSKDINFWDNIPLYGPLERKLDYIEVPAE